ncbi:MAG: ABC transporter ATP-binding protein [Vicinamibacterales bacterium]
MTTADPPALRCAGLVKRYADVVAVNGLDIEVDVGECFGLLGPNGAGKTTAVEILEGLITPDAGVVEVLGMRWDRDERRLRERIGVQLQETRLSEKLTVAELLRLFRSFYGAGRSVDEVLALIGLESKRHARFGKLSGGQKQRLSVACALVGSPDILFLDEPTTGLDPQSRRQLWDLLVQFRRSGGTILITTHYMEEAATLCDRIAIVDQGRVIALGTPAELIARLGASDVIEFSVDAPEGVITRDALRGVSAVHDARQADDAWRVSTGELHVALPALLAMLDAHAVPLRTLATHHATLEDVFVALTGRHLRDE